MQDTRIAISHALIEEINIFLSATSASMMDFADSGKE